MDNFRTLFEEDSALVKGANKIKLKSNEKVFTMSTDGNAVYGPFDKAETKNPLEMIDRLIRMQLGGSSSEMLIATTDIRSDWRGKDGKGHKFENYRVLFDASKSIKLTPEDEKRMHL